MYPKTENKKEYQKYVLVLEEYLHFQQSARADPALKACKNKILIINSQFGIAYSE